MTVRDTITFPDGDVTVTLSPVPMRAFFEFVGLWATPSAMEETLEQVREFVRLAEPEWTFEAASFEDLDFGLIRAVVSAWVQRVKEVPPPLPVASSATTPSPASQRSQPNSRARRRSTTS